MLMLLNVVSVAVLCGTAASQGFSYRDPTQWAQNSPMCAGQNQSPVDIPWSIIDFGVIESRSLSRINYDRIPDSMRVVNTGHTIQIFPTWNNNRNRPFLRGGPLTGDYVIEQFHFHWGDSDNVGSEHTFNGTRTAMELHMVHWKRSYGSLEAAAGHADGLAVVAGLYNPIFARSSNGIEQIWRLLGSVQRENAQTQVNPFPLSDFGVMRSQELYVSYFGSLTTPGCNEAVTWLVSMDLYSITSDELQQIRTVSLHEGDRLNYRPVQPLNGRRFRSYRGN